MDSHQSGLRKVSLRPIVDSDLDLLAGWFGNPEFIEWWKSAPLSRQEVAERYLNQRNNKRTFLVLVGSQPVGYIQALLEKGLGDEPVASIDLIVAPWAQGQGVGLQAAQRLLHILFSDFDCQNVSVDPHPDNQRAVSFWKRAGFQEFYREKDAIWMVVSRPSS